MTSFAVTTSAFDVEDRSWLFGLPGPSDVISLTLDIDAFTLATYTSVPLGYIPSGVVLSKLTATNLYVPYDDVGTDGSEIAACILFSTVKVPNMAALTVNAGGAGLIRGSVATSRLPVGHGLNAAAQADLKFIDFSLRY